MRRRRQKRGATTAAYSGPKGPYTDYKAGGGVGPINDYGNSPSPGYSSAYPPQAPAPQYGTSPAACTHNSVSPNTAVSNTREVLSGDHGTGMHKQTAPADGTSASLAGGPIDGVGANEAPVHEKMGDNVAATQPQEMEAEEGASGVRRGRGVRHELE
jgi:hypothetical protein